MILNIDNTEDQLPAVSVILPIYNAGSYLRDAIDSILAQSYTDFELLALDDGSTDDSLAILKEYESKDPRVKLFTRENRGLVATLNELIESAKGRYIARMDGDDICDPDRFEKQVRFMELHPDHVVVGSSFEKINESGQSIGEFKAPQEHQEIDVMNLAGHTSICHPTAMIRTTAIRQINGYDPATECAEDLDLWLRIAEIGELANLADVLVKYRMHDDSISEANRLTQEQLKRDACERAWERRGIHGSYEAQVWRPGSDKESQHDFALKYGWYAWRHGHRDTWWSYVKKALALKPFAVSSWKLLIFGYVKSPH